MKKYILAFLFFILCMNMLKAVVVEYEYDDPDYYEEDYLIEDPFDDDIWVETRPVIKEVVYTRPSKTVVYKSRPVKTIVYEPPVRLTKTYHTCYCHHTSPGALFAGAACGVFGGILGAALASSD